MLASTRQFIDAMEAKGIKYQDKGSLSNGKDVIIVSYSGDNMPSIQVQFFFDEDCESVALRVFDILKIPADRMGSMLSVLNAQNVRFRFARFVLDSNDNTVQVEMDIPFRKYDVGDICLEMLSRMVNICDEVYPTLMKGLWG